MKYIKGDEIFLEGRGDFTKKFEVKFSKNITQTMYFLSNYYGLDKGFFMLDPEDEGSNYKFDKVTEDLVALMMKCVNETPFKVDEEMKYNKKISDLDTVLDKISLDEYIKYTEGIIEKVNKLPDDLKYKIQKNDAFLINVNMVQTLPILMDKIAEFIDLILDDAILKHNALSCGCENPIIKSTGM